MQTDYDYNMGNLTYIDIQEYLKKKDIERYRDLINRLGLRR